jgi:hypothetical protein
MGQAVISWSSNKLYRVYLYKNDIYVQPQGSPTPNATANSNTSSSGPYQGPLNYSQQLEPQQFLPVLSVLQQIITAETGVTVSMNDTINYDNSSSLPHAHYYGNQLYQPQPSLSGPSTEQETEAARTHFFRPLESTKLIPPTAVSTMNQETSTSFISSNNYLYQNKRKYNQLDQ